jgi:hypothetical protein
MSAENTPILSGAIPAFELFMSSWKSMVAERELQAENVAQFIRPGLDVAAKYYNRFGDTDAYIVSMCKCSLFFFWEVLSEYTIGASHQSVRSFGMDQTELVRCGSSDGKENHFWQGLQLYPSPWNKHWNLWSLKLTRPQLARMLPAQALLWDLNQIPALVHHLVLELWVHQCIQE